MYKKTYYCKQCDFNFERVPISDDEKVKCPLCGQEDLELIQEEKKEPASCNTSSKYT